LESLTELPVEGVSEGSAGPLGGPPGSSVHEGGASGPALWLGLGLESCGLGDDEGIGANNRLVVDGFGLGDESRLSPSGVLGLGDIERDLFHGVFVGFGGCLRVRDIRRVGVFRHALCVHGEFATVGGASAMPGDASGRAGRFRDVPVLTGATDPN
jgi:hypothetical protein